MGVGWEKKEGAPKGIWLLCNVSSTLKQHNPILMSLTTWSVQVYGLIPQIKKGLKLLHFGPLHYHFKCQLSKMNQLWGFLQQKKQFPTIPPLDQEHSFIYMLGVLLLIHHWNKIQTEMSIFCPCYYFQSILNHTQLHLVQAVAHFDHGRGDHPGKRDLLGHYFM